MGRDDFQDKWITPAAKRTLDKLSPGSETSETKTGPGDGPKKPFSFEDYPIVK